MDLIFDIEANGLLPEVDQIFCIGICDVQDASVQSYSNYDPTLPSLNEGIERLKSAERLIGHNVIGYDIPVLNILCGADLDINKAWDTMVVGALVEPSRRSIALASYGEQFKFPKGNFDDFTKYTDEMRIYMEQDVALTHRLFMWLQQRLNFIYKQGFDFREAIKLEHQVQQALVEQNRHGFKFDVKAAEELNVKLTADIEKLSATLDKVFRPQLRPVKGSWCFKNKTWKNPDEFTPAVKNSRMNYSEGASLTRCKIEAFNPSSREQVAVRLNQEYGWKPTEFTNDGRPKLDESTLSDLDYPEAALLRSYFRKTKQLGMLAEGKAAWLKLHKKGRMHGYVRSCGSRTHRMSHRAPNMAQVDKDRAMRSLFVPDRGHVLVGCDADALELRMLACYLHEFDNGAYGDAVLNGTKEQGTDPHTLNQKAAQLHSRDKAKTFYYALIYGAGDQKLGSVIFDDLQAAGEPLPPKAHMTRLGREARSNLEKGVVGLGHLINKVQAQADARGYLKLPDGRSAATSVRTALNTLLQGSGSVLMKQALALFYHELAPSEGLVHGSDYALLANVHDEQQLSVKPDLADLVGGLFALSITMAGQRLNLPIAFSGDYQIGANWAETH